MTKPEKKVELLINIFENLRTMISHADTKAGIALGLQSFIFTSIFGTSLVQETSKQISVLNDGVRSFYYFLLFIFFIAGMLCIIFCILVFTPRPPQEDDEKVRPGLTYFEHIASYKSSSEYLKAIEKADTDALLEEFSCQSFTLGKIVTHKMKWAKYAVNALFASIFFGSVLLYFSLMVR